MIREISWYIEKNRFSNIVNDLETKAESYENSLINKKKNSEKLREEFRQLCQWHMEKSGYRSTESSFINVDLEFFNGAELNKEALHTFEKEIIKAHMYQKHLWEFMGTTGTMTVISKLGMKKDGFIYENYLPIEYRKTNKPKSPISNILKENQNAVPMYIYSDGNISNEYDPEKSKARFDTLKDKSGFDWSKKGWDPNYEIQKEDWRGEYDKDGNWIMVRNSDNPEDARTYSGAKLQSVPVIELIKEGNSGILYDPGNSLLNTFERIFILTNGQVYGAETQDTLATVSLIKDAMKELGIKQIVQVNGKDANTVQFYKKLFRKEFSDNAVVKSNEQILKIKEQIIQKEITKQLSDEGKLFSEKIKMAVANGEKENEIIKTIQTNKIKVPLSVFNENDCKEQGITDEEMNILKNYAVPDDKKLLFSSAIFNLLKQKDLLETSGKTPQELFDTVYETVVQGKKTSENISIETTFEELCLNPSKVLTTQTVEEATVAKLKQIKENLPEQKEDMKKAVNDAVDNVIRNFSAIRMSTGITPEEAVNKAVKTVGGRTGEFTPPVNGISYTTQNQQQKATRIFSDISLGDFIDTTNTFTKEVDFSTAPMKSSVNLFNDTERNSWYNTKEFKKTGFNKNDFESFTQTYMNSIKSDSVNIPVKNYSATTLLDNAFGYSTKQDYPTPLARIEAVTKIRPVETVVAEMNKTSSQKFEAAEIKKDGRIERKFDFEKEIVQTIKPVVHYPVQQQKTTEAERMAKINANYEHDKKMLAKKDPVFAKNQFWDVGHAEGEGKQPNPDSKRDTNKKTIIAANKIMDSFVSE